MKIAYSLISFFFLLFYTPDSFSQSKKEMAALQAKQAMYLIEGGKPDEAIKLLENAKKLDPSNINYPYEIAYARYSKKEYARVIVILEKLLQHKDVNSKVYQLLGNSYDNLKERDKAIRTYTAGLNYFPKAPELYLELGNMSLGKKDYYDALRNYENGIEADPMFPSNYYWAAKLYCSSAEKLWGMIYGEIFLNLERNTKRTAEISKLLYYTYKTQIRFYADSSVSVNFSKNVTVVTDPGKTKTRFAKDIFEPALLKAIGKERSISINTLCTIRKKFIESYYDSSLYQQYPNVLFDYQYKAFRAGLSEAYTNWVLSSGNETESANWIKENATTWQRFMAWFLDTKMPLDSKYKFLSREHN